MVKKLLETKIASADDFQYVWRVYSEAVKSHITPHLKDGWNDAVQMEQFRTMWSPSESHIITVDNEPIGWGAVVASGNEVRLDHLYIEPAHRGKGYTTRLLRELLAQWSREGKTVTAPILKDERLSQLASHLGFQRHKEHSNDLLTNTFVYQTKVEPD